ncbi:MAG: universal stress protein [Methylobacterium sp.]|nr:universal stress protein [Methylobacterium sp.]MCA3604295.1 universal stress protein [Methylobacterium sp.]MCA3616328.1 universal stress protein [Methylobacterium sp.]MCA4910821.1 universal stress protein [Methylobacterium sp.]
MPRSQSPLSSLSCIIRLTEDVPSIAIREAISLAAAHHAHLLVTIIAAKASVPFSPIGAGYVVPMVEEINERAEANGTALAESVREKLRREGVNGTLRLILNHVDIVAEEAVRLARASDLIVVDQPDAALDTKGLILEEALFHSGRPILVATTRRAMATHPGRIVVGWDGSAHAARAVGDALALFPGIEMAEIVSVAGEKDLSNALPGADLARHLAHKGVTTTLTKLSAEGMSVGSVLDGHATRTNADLIVMGGFGHSRLREFLFGGVTVELTGGASVPLLIAY